MSKPVELKIAELQCRTQLTSQALSLVVDPLWSTIAGFVVVHELRKQDLVGPIADDILYAGIIAINAARTPGIAGLAGQVTQSLVAPIVAGGAAGLLARSAGGGAAAAARAGSALLPVAAVAALTAGSTYAGLKLTNPNNPMWKRILGTAIGGPLTTIYRGYQNIKSGLKGKK